jgi:hypothetical protein
LSSSTTPVTRVLAEFGDVAGDDQVEAVRIPDDLVEVADLPTQGLDRTWARRGQHLSGDRVVAEQAGLADHHVVLSGVVPSHHVEVPAPAPPPAVVPAAGLCQAAGVLGAGSADSTAAVEAANALIDEPSEDTMASSSVMFAVMAPGTVYDAIGQM